MNPIDGLILAGGRSRRFGGADKGLARWCGRPLVAHVAAALAPQVAEFRICANRNAERYTAFGPVIDDGRWRDCGPLAGLRAGLAGCRRPWLAYVPVDAVRLPPDLVARLLAAALDTGRDAAMTFDGGSPVPTCGLLRTSLLPQVETALTGSRRALRDFLNPLQPAAVCWPPGAWVWSVNTPAELAALAPDAAAGDCDP
ncbi:MAG: NTP transferase domain-containing protein [Gammaproteobacteria bacterium]|nr:NTP transferase domain-containing protein [Gammaproteobacteria bacterium]